MMTDVSSLLSQRERVPVVNNATKVVNVTHLKDPADAMQQLAIQGIDHYAPGVAKAIQKMTFLSSVRKVTLTVVSDEELGTRGCSIPEVKASIEPAGYRIPDDATIVDFAILMKGELGEYPPIPDHRIGAEENQIWQQNSRLHFLAPLGDKGEHLELVWGDKFYIFLSDGTSPGLIPKNRLYVVETFGQ